MRIMDTKLLDDYKAACRSQKLAWDALADRLPGSKDYDPEAWHQWRQQCLRMSEALGALGRSMDMLPRRLSAQTSRLNQ